MLIRRQLLLIAIVVALVPATTSAVASPGGQCTALVSAAQKQTTAVGIVRDRQLAALARADRRVGNLISQAEAQGHNLTTVKTDRSQLEQQTSSLRQDYGRLAVAIAATGTLCGTPDSRAAVASETATTRSALAALATWYSAHLKPDLEQLAATK